MRTTQIFFRNLMEILESRGLSFTLINFNVTYTIYGVIKYLTTTIYLTYLKRFEIFWGQIGVRLYHT